MLNDLNKFSFCYFVHVTIMASRWTTCTRVYKKHIMDPVLLRRMLHFYSFSRILHCDNTFFPNLTMHMMISAYHGVQLN